MVRKDIENEKKTSVRLCSTNFSTNRRLFRPTKLKIVGGDKFLVDERRFFRSVNRRYKIC